MLDTGLVFPVKPWQASGSLSEASMLVKEVVSVLSVSVSPGLHESGVNMVNSIIIRNPC